MILAASAASLHPSFASLLNCSSISSFLSLCSIPKKISHFLSVLHADPLSKVHLSSFASFFHFGPVFSFWLLPPLWNLLRPSPLFHLDFLLLPPFHISVLFCNPSAAALTQSQFCSQSTMRKSHLPVFLKTCLSLWDVCHSSCLSVHSPFSSSPFFLFFSSTYFPSASSELATFPPAPLKILGSSPWLFV